MFRPVDEKTIKMQYPKLSIIQSDELFDLYNQAISTKDPILSLSLLNQGLKINPYDTDLKLEYILITKKGPELEKGLKQLLIDEKVILHKIKGIKMDEIDYDLYINSDFRPTFRVLWRLSEYYVEQELFPKAIKVYEEMLLRNENDNFGVRYLLPRIQLKANKFNQAKNFYDWEYPVYNLELSDQQEETIILSREAIIHMLVIYAHYKKPNKFKEILSYLGYYDYVKLKQGDISYELKEIFKHIGDDKHKLLVNYLNDNDIEYGIIVKPNKQVDILDIDGLFYIYDIIYKKVNYTFGKDNLLEILKAVHKDTNPTNRDVYDNFLLIDYHLQKLYLDTKQSGAKDDADSLIVTLKLVHEIISNFEHYENINTILSRSWFNIFSTEIWDFLNPSALLKMEFPNQMEYLSTLYKIPFDMLKQLRLTVLSDSLIEIKSKYNELVNEIDKINNRCIDSELSDFVATKLKDDAKRLYDNLITSKNN